MPRTVISRQLVRGVWRTQVAADVPAGGEGGGGGATSLTDLTDVTGEPAPGLSPVADESAELFPLTRVTTQEDLDAILVQVATVEWRTITLLNSFVNSGAPYANARYRLTLNNLVYVEGRIERPGTGLTNANAGTVLARLDGIADAAPTGNLIFLAATGSATLARLVLTPQGEIKFDGLCGGSATIYAVSLNAITYSVEAATSALLATTMTQHFEP